MEICETPEYFFIRLEPGERIMPSLKEATRAKNIRVGAITSGVGMVAEVEFGFFCTDKDNYDTERMKGIFDLSSIQGSITWRGSEPVPHVHMTINDRQYRTFSGHVMDASCHITMEIFIRRLSELNVHRVKVDGQPATRITAVR